MREKLAEGQLPPEETYTDEKVKMVKPRSNY